MKNLHKRHDARTPTPASLSCAPSSNLSVTYDAMALTDTDADYSIMNGKLSRRQRKVMTAWDGPYRRRTPIVTPVGRCRARSRFTENHAL